MDNEKYKSYKLPHPLLLHWILNPGLCINEVILGQRIPKVTLVDQTSDAPLNDRSFVECSHCQSMHNGLLWSKKLGFGHYQGLFCPTCEEKIPTLLNIFSLILLILTFPIWKPIQIIYGERHKKWDIKRSKQIHAETPNSSKPNFLHLGLGFGFFMGVFFFILGIITNGFSNNAVKTAIISGIFCGLAFGITMKIVLMSRAKSKI